MPSGSAGDRRPECLGIAEDIVSLRLTLSGLSTPDSPCKTQQVAARPRGSALLCQRRTTRLLCERGSTLRVCGHCESDTHIVQRSDQFRPSKDTANAGSGTCGGRTLAKSTCSVLFQKCFDIVPFQVFDFPICSCLYHLFQVFLYIRPENVGTCISNYFSHDMIRDIFLNKWNSTHTQIVRNVRALFVTFPVHRPPPEFFSQPSLIFLEQMEHWNKTYFSRTYTIIPEITFGTKWTKLIPLPFFPPIFHLSTE